MIADGWPLKGFLIPKFDAEKEKEETFRIDPCDGHRMKPGRVDIKEYELDCRTPLK